MKIEDVIQAEIVEWFNNTYCLKFHIPRYMIFSVPNGGTRNKLEAIKMKSTGLLAGVADLIIVLDRTVFVEVKTEAGTQSPEQKEFEKRIKDLGHEYYLVRSLEDFKLLITRLINCI